MNNVIVFLLLFCGQILVGQEAIEKQELLFLAKVYKENHAGNPTNEVLLKLKSIKSPNLEGTRLFLSESILKNNSIATHKYLTKPDSSTLENLYIIRGLTWNMYSLNKSDKTFGIDSLLNQKTKYNELLANYYSMLFISVSNKNEPFDMSDVNFNMNDYGLTNLEEKGIFYLESMKSFGSLISGYFSFDPPKYKSALSYISKFPKYNGDYYYNYVELDFEDFDFLYSSNLKESYKKCLINELMITILNHCISVYLEGDITKMNEIFSNSIIKNQEYWGYSESPEIFKEIFQR